jgi:putative endonuclease
MAYHVYILSNRPNGTLYIGFTGDLARRIYEHREGAVPSFTRKYGLRSLVYFETFDEASYAMQREKALKRWNRSWKIELIEKHNPDWHDLYPTLLL